MFSAVTWLLSLVHFFFFIFFFWGGGGFAVRAAESLVSCFCHNLGGKVTGCGTQCELDTK